MIGSRLKLESLGIHAARVFSLTTQAQFPQQNVLLMAARGIVKGWYWLLFGKKTGWRWKMFEFMFETTWCNWFNQFTKQTVQLKSVNTWKQLVQENKIKTPCITAFTDFDELHWQWVIVV